jgi:hypothetical protein
MQQLRHQQKQVKSMSINKRCNISNVTISATAAKAARVATAETG